MSAPELATVLRRRWYVLALAGLLTLLGAFAVHMRPLSYQGCENLYLSGTPSVDNVYFNNNQSLPIMTGIVTQAMMSQPMQQRIHAGGITDYAVTQTNTGEIRFPSYDQPTLQVCATSATPDGTLSGVQLITTDIRSVLYEMQATQHASADSFIRVIQLTGAVPVPIIGQPSLAYLGVLLIGGITAVSLALWSHPFLNIGIARAAPSRYVP
jgi:hypothetical protein